MPYQTGFALVRREPLQQRDQLVAHHGEWVPWKNRGGGHTGRSQSITTYLCVIARAKLGATDSADLESPPHT